MKYLILLVCALLAVGLPTGATKDTLETRVTEADPTEKSEVSCMTGRDLEESLAGLESPLSNPASHRENLVRYAKRSPKCRTQVVSALLRAMAKPDLNLEKDQAAFFLWHFGGEVLGALRASEALDLLIANLGVTDGESPSMTHYPAVETVIRIGTISIPKLRNKLQYDDRAGMRRLAVFCIAKIGGEAAKRTLVEALPKEHDKCVNDFIRFTLKSFGNKRRPNHLAPEDSVKWSTFFYCSEA